MVAAVEEPAEMLFEPVETPQEDAVPMEGVVEVQEAPAGADQDSELRGEYIWVVENFSKQGDKVYSPKFEIGTHLWKMLLCPRGLHCTKDFLSVFLDSPEAGWVPDHLNPKATFKLTILNHLEVDGKKVEDFGKESNHKWNKDQSDWGFTQFLPYAEAMNPERGWTLNDALHIKVEIQVQRNERYAYDSRKETGHVGLKNQGATCYMNSLLQYLYHLPYLRQAVYHMPTNENDEPGDSLPLALQSLFYRLQYSHTPVSTKDLTKSFGWSSMDAFMQHDVQELNRVLCEKLEEKMKGTRAERVINELFEGHTSNYLECVNVDYKSSRRESFMDLQLDVKGCDNIYDSFDKYTEVEMMVGDNQYKAEGYGLQDAKKGVLFDDFPPVLQLQLKRFEYNFQTDAMVKINDRYEFYDELDLDLPPSRAEGKYMSPQADRKVRNLYKLHSVLVHSGGVHGGHYYAYVRPDGKQWLKFDDTAVTLEDDARALDEQFGGDDSGVVPMQTQSIDTAGGLSPAVGPKRLGGLKFNRCSNAYMLVYVRVSDWPRFMGSVTKDDIAPYLRERLEAEQREKERRQKEKQEAHLYCHVRIATDQDIAQQVGINQFFDLVYYDKLDASRTFRVRKLTQFEDFKQQVEAATGVPADKQRYWVWNKRQNATLRPNARLKPSEEQQPLVDLREYREKQGSPGAKHALMDLRLYLETPWPPTMREQTPQRNDINLFFKYYDWQAEKLSYVGHRYVDKKLRVCDLYGLMCKLAGLPDGTPLLAFEEVKWDPEVMIPELDPNQVLGVPGMNQLESGDIICFQQRPPEELVAAHKQRQAHAAQAKAAAASGISSMDIEGLPEQQQQQQLGPLGLAGGQDQQQLSEQQDQQQLSQQLSQQHLEQQLPQSHGGQSRFPIVVDFLAYTVNRRLVTFKRIEDPKEPGLQLELLKDYSYDMVTSALAAKLNLSDPTRLRLTQHNAFSSAPQRQPMRYRGVDVLEHMLLHARHAVDLLYYEVMDIPLPELEQLKTFTIQFHNDKTEFVGEHVVRVARDGCVADVLDVLSKRLGPDYEGRQLRLLEIHRDQSKIFKVADPSGKIGNWNENYWLLRAEPIPAEEQELAEGDIVICVAHIAAPKQAPGSTPTSTAGNEQPADPAAAAAGNNNGSKGGSSPAAAGGGGLIPTLGPIAPPAPVLFGDPFLLRVGPQETVGQVRARIQQKLGVAAADFEAWKVAFVSNRAAPHYLADDEVLAQHISSQPSATADADYLALEHEDKGPRRPTSSTTRYGYERAIKIAS